MEIKIEYLIDNQQYVEIVARWIFDEFIDNIKPGQTYDMVVDRYKDRGKDDFPITIIAINDSECIGTVSLVSNDLKSRDYTPWLASLYIKEEFRSKGIGKVLINRIISIAKEFGYDYLYLRTEHATKYYEKLGWEFVESLKDEYGLQASVFKTRI